MPTDSDKAILPSRPTRATSKPESYNIVVLQDQFVIEPAATPSSPRPAKKARKTSGISHDKGHSSYVTTSAARGDTRKNHTSPLGSCRCTAPDAPQCKRCKIEKIKIDFSGVDGFDTVFKGMGGAKKGQGKTFFYVLASKDAVKKSWSK